MMTTKSSNLVKPAHTGEKINGMLSSPRKCDKSAVFWLRDMAIMAPRVQDKLSTTHAFCKFLPRLYHQYNFEKERSMNKRFNAHHDSEILEIVCNLWCLEAFCITENSTQQTVHDLWKYWHFSSAFVPFHFHALFLVHVFSRAKNRRSWHVTLWRPCGIFSRADKCRLC